MTLVKCILVVGAAVGAAFGPTALRTDAGPAPLIAAVSQAATNPGPIFDMGRMEQMFRR